MSQEHTVAGHLKGTGVIARVFGVNRNTVVKWKKSGAPIITIGRKNQADYALLWEWLIKKGLSAKPCQ